MLHHCNLPHDNFFYVTNDVSSAAHDLTPFKNCIYKCQILAWSKYLQKPIP